MHKIILALCLTLVACAKPDQHPNQTGRLQNSNIKEASGLARSNIDADRLWVMNDGGAGTSLYMVGLDGSDLGTFNVAGATNEDWEDLAAFIIDDIPMLLIADFGDNLGLRDHATLYVVQEPDVSASDGHDSVDVAWQVEFTFPDGALDAESVSVDVENDRVLVLSKREIPAVLYEVPLRHNTANSITAVVATRIGPVTSLPQPSEADRNRALANLDWYWQPTAMDISPPTNRAAILTYRGLYIYQRAIDQTWYDALQSAPHAIESGGFNHAESVAFTADGSAVFVTSEQTHAQLLRFDLD